MRENFAKTGASCGVQKRIHLPSYQRLPHHSSMKNLYHRLLLLIAGSTQKQLAAQIQYLKAENEVLRARLPKHIRTTAQERSRLIKFGKKLGEAIQEIVTIVSPNTLKQWIRNASKPKGNQPVPKGRPRIKEPIRELILRMARENDWGYTRIMGEFKKLGITPPSRPGHEVSDSLR